MELRSVCSSGRPVTYLWRGGVDIPGSATDIQQTSAHLITLLKNEGFQFNPYTEAFVEAQIEDRLLVAERGRLKPVEHIKRIQRSGKLDLFEIRWNNIELSRVLDKASGLVGSPETVPIRLYIVEADQPKVVGLLIHRKVIVEGETEETRRRQNCEIDKAIGIYDGLVGQGVDPFARQ